MALTFFEPIPMLRGEAARIFAEKVKNPTPVVLSSAEIESIKEILKFSGYNINGTSKK